MVIFWPCVRSVMQNNRREHFQNVKRNSIKNVADGEQPHDLMHSHRSSSRCQLFVANELNQLADRKGQQRHCSDAEWTANKGVNGYRNNSIISGIDLATDGYVTADEESGPEDVKPATVNVVGNQNQLMRPLLPGFNVNNMVWYRYMFMIKPIIVRPNLWMIALNSQVSTFPGRPIYGWHSKEFFKFFKFFN